MTTKLDLSQSLVKKGQALIASLNNGPASSADIRWTVTPSSLTHLSANNNQAVVLFAGAGTYHVTATYAGTSGSFSDSTTAVVSVSDSVYAPPASLSFDTLSLAGDQLILQPQSDSNGALIFFAQSVKNYDCYPTSFMYGFTGGPNGASGLAFSFDKVVTESGGNCNGIKSPAYSYLFVSSVMQGWGNGTFPLSVELAGTTYTGTVTISPTTYTFNWNYTSGVTISPLVVNR
jgi:hypothetical protein